ncbi:MAG: hypothetical protein V1755_13745 [Chloroflexota bacterium]
MENKNVYYAWAGNDQGASTDVFGRGASQRKVEDAARRQLGAGWQVHVMRVDVDGDGQSVMGVTEVKTFRTRR